VPIAAILGGAAEKLKPSMGRAARLVRCSTIGIPAPRRIAGVVDVQRVDADQGRPLVSKVLRGSLR
jgi:hypothetical protein